MAKIKTSKAIIRAGETVRVPDVGSHVSAWPVSHHPTGGPGRWGILVKRLNSYTYMVGPAVSFAPNGDVTAFSGNPVLVVGDLDTPAAVRAIAERRHATAVRDYDFQVRAGIDVRGERPKRPAWLGEE